jgi:probable rRNA maturation factor
MITFQIKQEYQIDFNEKILEKWVKRTLDYLEKDNYDLSIVIASNSEIHQLNREYRHIDAPTDVLSFAYDMVDPETNTRYLGDIIISAEKVHEQAKQAGHSPQLEICTLIVHGILHLLGYDHEEQTDEAIMFQLQGKLIEVVYKNGE